MSTLRVIRTAFLMHLRQMAVDNMVIFIIVVQPLFIALLAIYMLRDSPGFAAIYVIVGSGMTGLWSGTLAFCSNSILDKRHLGTLESIIASPTHLMTVIVGESLANVCLSLVSMFLCYPFAALLFGYSLSIADPLAFGISLLVAIVALLSAGMLLTSLFGLTPGSEIWVNAMEFPMYIIGGFLFSIALLPAWMTPISHALTPYWAARALHASSNASASLEDIVLSWGMVLGLSIVYWLISAWLFRIMLRRSRRDATLAWQ